MSDDYVKPPGAKNDYVVPPQGTGNDYVAPPRQNQNDDYVAPPQQNTVAQDHTGVNKQVDYVDPYVNPSYFGTPKVGIRFYLTGYLAIASFMVITSETYSTFLKIIFLAYILLSNYTYSWYADYQRYKGGDFSWFFTPYGSAKVGWSSSQFSNYRTGTISKGWLGNYKYSERESYSSHIIHVVVVTLILELLKFMIAAPIAFITLFTHKSTIQKYNALVDYNESFNN